MEADLAFRNDTDERKSDLVDGSDWDYTGLLLDQKCAKESLRSTLLHIVL